MNPEVRIPLQRAALCLDCDDLSRLPTHELWFTGPVPSGTSLALEVTA